MQLGNDGTLQLSHVRAKKKEGLTVFGFFGNLLRERGTTTAWGLGQTRVAQVRRKNKKMIKKKKEKVGGKKKKKKSG